MNFSDLLAAVGVVINGLPQGLLALTFGFASIPTAIGFAVGALGVLLFGLVAPISFQAETITLAGTLGDTLRDRLSMVFYGGVLMALIGLLGLLEATIDFIGPAILSGMMAGVGIILTRVAIDMTRDNRIAGGTSILAALLVYIFTQDLVYTIVVSVFIGSLIPYLTDRESLSKAATVTANVREEIRFERPQLNPVVIRGALAMMCINIGANITFGGITADIAAAEINIDHLTITSALANMGSSLFGGGPVESIISATGAAPNPVLSGALMMGIMAIILIAGLLPRIGRYIPAQSIAGFLLILGAMVTVPNNIGPMTEMPLAGGTALAVTAVTDPFTGMIAAVIVRTLAQLAGLGL